ncbi:MAG: 3-hydroxyacyl-ACP dehydratase FabZ [Candidatus Omnitrophota bacterium]|nr:3-hydroxyacyl-ACP dehydratase FabZ [Candidatus Omnitrophota bacterium]
MPAEWDINKIQEILPQKYPFLFIDRVLEADADKKKVTCLKNVTINDYFFAGHFPGNPVMPGALILEAMAQASIVLYTVIKPQIAQKRPDYYLGKVEVKFLSAVRPGDQLILEAQGVKTFDQAGIVNVRALVNGKLCAQARIMFGVKAKNG